jgi:hypothetical protein
MIKSEKVNQTLVSCINCLFGDFHFYLTLRFYEVSNGMKDLYDSIISFVAEENLYGDRLHSKRIILFCVLIMKQYSRENSANIY